MLSPNLHWDKKPRPLP